MEKITRTRRVGFIVARDADVLERYIKSRKPFNLKVGDRFTVKEDDIGLHSESGTGERKKRDKVYTVTEIYPRIFVGEREVTDVFGNTVTMRNSFMKSQVLTGEVRKVEENDYA